MAHCNGNIFGNNYGKCIFHFRMAIFPLFVVIILTASALDLSDVKIQYCQKLKSHWVYDRLMLKTRCLEMAKLVGSELCIDVNKIIVCFH